MFKDNNVLGVQKWTKKIQYSVLFAKIKICKKVYVEFWHRMFITKIINIKLSETLNQWYLENLDLDMNALQKQS